MTPGEIKFALQVEAILNKITQPEYRQLMVEAIMILCLFVEHDGNKCHWNEMVVVDKLVHHANEIFIKEQVSRTVSESLMRMDGERFSVGNVIEFDIPIQILLSVVWKEKWQTKLLLEREVSGKCLHYTSNFEKKN